MNQSKLYIFILSTKQFEIKGPTLMGIQNYIIRKRIQKIHFNQKGIKTRKDLILKIKK